jgi:hypothetical protein
MTPPKSERPASERLTSERVSSERLGDADQAVANEFEGEIREFVRRDVTHWRRQQRNEPATDAVADSVNAVIQRVSSASVEEIERVIGDLQTMRDELRAEGERVQREIAGYANLSQAAMASMKIMSESLTRWKPAPAVRSDRAVATIDDDVRSDAV